MTGQVMTLFVALFSFRFQTRAFLYCAPLMFSPLISAGIPLAHCHDGEFSLALLLIHFSLVRLPLMDVAMLAIFVPLLVFFAPLFFAPVLIFFAPALVFFAQLKAVFVLVSPDRLVLMRRYSSVGMKMY